MKFETVGRVSVGDLRLEIRWEIDDIYGTKGTLLNADATANAKPLRNVGDLGLWGDFDTQLARPHDRTGLLAFLAAFLVDFYQHDFTRWTEKIPLTLGLHYLRNH